MGRGNPTKKHQMYVADFETADSWVSVAGEIPDQHVWLAGLMNVETKKEETFLNLDGFMDRILKRNDNVNIEIAFHNLKFDGSFILPWLFRNGWQLATGKPDKGEFSCLIDDRNQWYNITIQPTKKRKITIWDSLKLFPSKLEYLPDLYGTPTRKIQEDESFYNKTRLPGYQPNNEEYHYLHNDLLVLAETLDKHIEVVGLHFKKTQAGQAFYNFEQHFKHWKLRFPPLETKTDKRIRPAYWGGISTVNPKHQGVDCLGVVSYDINSSYPHQMASKPLPYGHLEKTTTGQPPIMGKFWVATAYVEFTIKENKRPCIPKKGIIENRPKTSEKWLFDSGGVVLLTFCSIDYITIQNSYDFKVWRWVEVNHWKQKVHREIKEFIEINNKIKVDSKRASKKARTEHERNECLIRAFRAKVNNNGFYGKFGEDILKFSAVPYMHKGITYYPKTKEDEQTEYKRKYLPVAIATTAYARRQLIGLANALGKYFIYCDTDSVHLLKGGERIIKNLARKGTIKLDPVELGAWDREGEHAFGRFLRAKCYMEGGEKQGYEVTLAGLPADPHTGNGSKERSVITPENFYIGLIIEGGNGKLRTVRTPTGNKLLPVDFEIKENTPIF